jgi:hypothetical protein
MPNIFGWLADLFTCRCCRRRPAPVPLFPALEEDYPQDFYPVQVVTSSRSSTGAGSSSLILRQNGARIETPVTNIIPFNHLYDGDDDSDFSVSDSAPEAPRETSEPTENQEEKIIPSYSEITASCDRIIIDYDFNLKNHYLSQCSKLVTGETSAPPIPVTKSEHGW